MVILQNWVEPFSQSWVATLPSAIVHLLATVSQVVVMITVMVELCLLIVAALSQLTTAPSLTTHLDSVVGPLPCSMERTLIVRMSLVIMKQVTLEEL